MADSVRGSHLATSSTGSRFEVGDLVWAKVEPHLWWPGYIYDEKLVDKPLRKTKLAGRVLVGYFGDGCYWWFKPKELLPLEENFEEFSRQNSSEKFVRAIEEAERELHNLRNLGLLCRCRNKSNFQPHEVEGYLSADVGDGKPSPFSLNQITKQRSDFQPSEMFSFVRQSALAPMNGQHRTVEFIKNKGTVLAWRKAKYETNDVTYIQAFKAHLSDEMVIAKYLGKDKPPVEPTKANEQLGKNKKGKERKSKKAKVHKRPGGELNPVRRLSSPGDPIRSGRKRGPLEHIEQIGKVAKAENVNNAKQRFDLEETGKKKLKMEFMHSENMKRRLLTRKYWLVEERCYREHQRQKRAIGWSNRWKSRIQLSSL